MKDKLRFSTVLLVALFLVLAPTALAITTWYVDGVHGSDGNNCLSATPCKTIEHAILRAHSGDSIRVAAATYTENLTIGINLNVIGSGASTTIIDGGGYGTVVAILNSSAVTLSNLTIRNGSAQYGAGVNRITDAGALSIISTVITGNHALGCPGWGGGVFNYGTLTISNSTIKGNSASATCVGGTAIGGGVINNDGTLTITKSTISGNNVSVPFGCTPVRGGCTGGFASGGGISAPDTLNIANSTISGNTASASCLVLGRSCSAFGGGIDHSNFGGAMTMASSTLAGNSATCSPRSKCAAAGGGIENIGAATIQNSIVANSSNGNCDGVITSNGYNLSSDSTCNFSSSGDRNNIDPKLGALGSYGGPTQTVPLLLGSPAIDAGNPSGCTDGNGHLLKTDQRGYPRHDSEDTKGCDMGALEKQSD